MGLNFQDVIRDVHDPNNHALQISGTIQAAGQATVTLYSTPTIYAVVNTEAASLTGNVTLNPSPNYIGLTTTTVSNTTTNPGAAVLVDYNGADLEFRKENENWNAADHGLLVFGRDTASNPDKYRALALDDEGHLSVHLLGNVTLSDSKTYVGLTTSTIGNNPILGAGANYIGLVTSVPSNTVRSIAGNLTLSDSKAYIGLVSVSGSVGLNTGANYVGIVTVANPSSSVALNAGAAFVGIVTVANPSAFSGNVTLNPSSAHIGSVSIFGTVESTPGMTTLFPGPNYIGLVTAVPSNTVRSISGNLTLSDSKAYIGLVSVSGTVGLAAGANYVGLTSVNIGGTLPALSAGAAFVGIVTVANPSAFTGNVTLDAGSKTGIVGNLTLSDSKGFIGLVTVGGGAAWADPKTYIGLVTATLAGSVNTGMTTIFPGPNYIGLVSVNIGGTLPALTAGAAYIGLVTAVPSTTARSITGNLTLSDSMAYIGLVSVSGTVGLAAGANYVGLVTAVPSTTVRSITGNLTLSDSKASIGLVTLSGGTAWTDPKTYIGLVTATLAGSVNTGMTTIFPGPNYIGLVTAVVGNNPVLGAGANYVGLATVTLGPGMATVTLGTALSSSTDSVTAALAAGTNFVGFATVRIANNSGTVIGDVRAAGTAGVLLQQESSGSYGLKVTHYSNVTVSAVGGTTKTLIHKNIEMSTASVATIAVPTGGNAIFNITNLVLSSSATVRVSIKSGPTYLTGNATIGITLNPGGGWVETGAPFSPTYIGLASGAAIVVEKFDVTATSALVGGKVIYYQE